jgi:hypothetical protein
VVRQITLITLKKSQLALAKVTLITLNHVNHVNFLAGYHTVPPYCIAFWPLFTYRIPLLMFSDMSDHDDDGMDDGSNSLATPVPKTEKKT